MYDVECDDARGEIVEIIVRRGGEGLHPGRRFGEIGYYPKLGANYNENLVHQHEKLAHYNEILAHQHEILAHQYEKFSPSI